MINKKILLIGYGEIAQLCANQLLTRGFKITALSRTKRKAQIDTQPDQWQHIEGSVDDPKVQRCITEKKYDSIVITLTPEERSDSAYNYIYPKTLIDLKNLWDLFKTYPKQLIYVTSTSVYGQNHGEMVDEDSKTEPKRYNGIRLLEAENIAHQLALESQVATTCLRFAGIYGQGRYHLLDSVMKGQVTGEHYTNRIHVEDCAGLICHLIERFHQSGWYVPTLIGCDSLPVKAHEVRKWLYDELAKTLKMPQIQPARSMGNKRCDNRLLLKTGYILKYPDYTSGFTRIITDYCSEYQKNKSL